MISVALLVVCAVAFCVGYVAGYAHGHAIGKAEFYQHLASRARERVTSAEERELQ